MMYWDPDQYLKAWNFASYAHRNQIMPHSKIPYLNHIGSVAMEGMTAIIKGDRPLNTNLLIQCCLLHDTLEDTSIDYETLKQEFGIEVAEGVLALTKNIELSTKQAQMKDSLNRILQQPQEIWMVKMCDRITNLQQPPSHWANQKIINYQQEAILIEQKLGQANSYLSQRLKHKIIAYQQYINH